MRKLARSEFGKNMFNWDKTTKLMAETTAPQTPTKIRFIINTDRTTAAAVRMSRLLESAGRTLQ